MLEEAKKIRNRLKKVDDSLKLAKARRVALHQKLRGLIQSIRLEVVKEFLGVEQDKEMMEKLKIERTNTTLQYPYYWRTGKMILPKVIRETYRFAKRAKKNVDL